MKRYSCVSPFSYQTIETMVPKKLEFPKEESHTGKRKKLKPSASWRRNLSLGKRFYTVLITVRAVTGQTHKNNDGLDGT